MIDIIKLKNIMKAGRWNASNLAAASGVNQMLVWKIATGRSVPRVDVLVKICAALEIPITDLLIEETEKAAA